MTFGAVIVSAGLSSRMKTFKPMLEISNSTIIKKSICTLRAAGANPIVVVTGYKDDLLKKHLRRENVVLVHNANYATTDMFHSVKLGLQYMQDKCDYLFFTPGDVPLFSLNTLELFIADCKKPDWDLLLPSYKGKSGHPILLSHESVKKIVTYNGDNGLKGALQSLGLLKKYIEVNDEGVTLDADYKEDYDRLLSYAKETTVSEQDSVDINVMLKKSETYFDKKLLTLLKDIEKTNSINQSSKNTKISYSTCFKLIRIAENNLGFKLLDSTQGGINGGQSTLTDKCKTFIEGYEKIIIDSQQYAEQRIQQLLKDIHK